MTFSVLDAYFSQQGLDLLVSLLALFPVGIILAVSAWMVSILVHFAFRLIKG